MKDGAWRTQEIRYPLETIGVNDPDADTVAINVSVIGDSETGTEILAFRPVDRKSLEGRDLEQFESGQLSKADYRRRALLGKAVLRPGRTPPVIRSGAYSDPVTLTEDFDASAAPADDLAATWQAYYDDAGLHVRVTVTDDTLVSDSGDEWFQDDGIEIYLDADNGKAFNEYDPDDYHITVGLDGTLQDRRGHLGEGATASVERTDDGYVVEALLPWSATRIERASGTFVGLDVHVIDDDDGGAREAKLAWFAEIDQSYKNAALFGTVVLGE